jgi:hypothetical protein
MKFPIIIFFVFVLVTITGGALHEIIREQTARSFGYYRDGFSCGQLFFSNDTVHAAFTSIWKASGDSIRAHKSFPEKEHYDKLSGQNKRAHAFIELAAKVFTFSICLLGLVVLFIRRKMRAVKFAFIDWAGVIFSLFVMKQIVLSSCFIIWGLMFCDYAAFTQYFKLPFWGTEWAMIIFGLLISFFVVFKIVPRAKRISFFIGGLLGGLTGIVLWFFVVGKLLFGS